MNRYRARSLPTLSKPSPEPTAGAPLAPRWHTAALIALIVSVAVAGAMLGGGAAAKASPAPGSRVASVYVPLLIVQCSLAVYVVRIGRPRSALLDLIGERWGSARRACGDLLLALLGHGLIKAVELVWLWTSRYGAAGSVAAMLPHTPTERLVWALGAATVGVSEELVYRGYLQTQLTAFTGRASVAIVLQAVLFGLAHGEQGAASAIRIGLYGLGFGALAWRRRSLVPGILCHVGTDLASGLM